MLMAFRELEPDEVPRHRNLYCPNYDLCLNVAVVLNWPGFTCIKCGGEGPDDACLTETLLRLSDPTFDPYAPNNQPFRLDTYILKSTTPRLKPGAC